MEVLKIQNANLKESLRGLEENFPDLKESLRKVEILRHVVPIDNTSRSRILSNILDVPSVLLISEKLF